MKKTGLTILLASFITVGCASNRDKASTVPDMHTTEIALDWPGTYEGTFPCADCEGIKMSLKLLQDKTYILKEEYLTNRPGDKIATTTGQFQFEKTNPSLIRLDTTPDNRVFFVGEGYLEARDRETGKPFETKLNYKLIKK